MPRPRSKHPATSREEPSSLKPDEPSSLPLGILQLLVKELQKRPLEDSEVSTLRDLVAELQKNCSIGAGNIQPNDVTAEPETPPAQKKNALEHLLPWQQTLVHTFQQMDTDGSGTLSREELRNGLLKARMPQARLAKLMNLADIDQSGEIDLKEWIRVIRQGDPVLDEIYTIHSRLTLNLSESASHSKEQPLSCPIMMHPMSRIAVAWALFMGLLCIYVATVQIFVIAWEAEMPVSTLATFNTMNIAMDCLFLVDVLMNFLTGYYNFDGELVMEWKAVAFQYARTWFLLDLLSSLPLDNFQSSQIKLLKVGKLAKALRVFKPQTFTCAAHWQELDDFLHSFLVQMALRRVGVLLILGLLCHWLACGMKMVDDGFLSSFSGTGESSGLIRREYILAIYWAMTTLTTVGYGDITPQSNSECAYTIFAMVVGGGFYGYAVGSITSIVSASDMNASAYYERMDLTYAWMKHHRLPHHMRVHVIRYFKDFLSKRSAASEMQLWNTLSPALQRDVGGYIVHNEVKHNPLFDGLATTAVVRLQAILRTVTIPAGQKVTHIGEAGVAMYIITSGSVDMEMEMEMDASGNYASGNGSRHRNLGTGDSFGEEILLGLTDDYRYTTVVTVKASFEQILEDDFLELFRNMPNMKERMRKNALELHPEWKTEFLGHRGMNGS